MSEYSYLKPDNNIEELSGKTDYYSGYFTYRHPSPSRRKKIVYPLTLILEALCHVLYMCFNLSVAITIFLIIIAASVLNFLLLSFRYTTRTVKLYVAWY